MPIDVSKLMGPSDEEWAAMSEEEKVAAIREGHFNAKRKIEIEKNGSPALRAALEAYLKERPLPDLLGARIKIPSFTEAMRSLGLDSIRSDIESPLRLRRAFDTPMPELNITTPEERQSFESSREFIARLDARYKEWKTQLPPNAEPVIIALLNNGLAVRVLAMSPEGHNGVAITAEFEGAQCLVIAHQSTLQLICTAEIVAKEEERKAIGFVVPALRQSEE